MPRLIPTHREPTHPGAMLGKLYLQPLGLTVPQFAAAVELTEAQAEAILNGKERVTAGIAYRLAKYIGTSPDFWLNGQMVWDLYHAQRAEAAVLERIQPLAWEDFPEPEGLAENPAAAAAEVAAG